MVPSSGAMLYLPYIYDVIRIQLLAKSAALQETTRKNPRL